MQQALLHLMFQHMPLLFLSKHGCGASQAVSIKLFAHLLCVVLSSSKSIFMQTTLQSFHFHFMLLQISAEEQKKMDEKVMVDGVKRVVSKLLARRKLKRSYEYEVQWEGQPSSSDYTAWLSRDRWVLGKSTHKPCSSLYCNQLISSIAMLWATNSHLVCYCMALCTVSSQWTPVCNSRLLMECAH